MTLQESARQAYYNLWVMLVATVNPEVRDEALWELNFLKPFTEPGFREWAIKTLPFFLEFELNGIEIRQQALLEQMQRFLQSLKEQKGGE